MGTHDEILLQCAMPLPRYALIDDDFEVSLYLFS